MSPKPESIPSLYSLSGTSSFTSMISTPTNRSASPSPSLTTTTPTPSEFIFPIPFSGDPSETSPLLANRPRLCRICNCRHPNHIHGTASSPQPPSMQFRYCSIQRSSLFNIQIISGVLFIFCLAIIVLSPFSSRAENDTSTLQQDLKSSDDHSPLAYLHGLNNLTNINSSIQARTRTHKLDTPQLKGIEFAIVCFTIFTICSLIRAVSYVMSRWGLCFGGEGSDGNGGIFEEEEMMGYGHRRESMHENIV
ncbi:uncharacterized protein EAE97_000082 [Botrytis byssoidea]|uniref:Uncharacterized protein n=1 Tax=Botrytis byssoidea TaxID=139641 RepID=A0A9P5M411_9HELO|nr:uncharacterized protein EAE97_000082 [Botrytis byssoidea]KAF7954823.1 hypothetical protein EAE97_000082 [Botrytis byssoidea]